MDTGDGIGSDGGTEHVGVMLWFWETLVVLVFPFGRSWWFFAVCIGILSFPQGESTEC